MSSLPRYLALALGSLCLAACSGSVEGSQPIGGYSDNPTGTPPPSAELPTPPPADPVPLAEAQQPAVFGPAALRRLSPLQYENSVAALLGQEHRLETNLEEDVALNGLTSINQVEAALSGRATERFERAAFEVAERYVSSPPVSAVDCNPTQQGCFAEFVASIGRQVWRRPLTEHEVQRYVAVANQAASALNDPAQGRVYALAGLLQSPHFLYRVELGQPDSEFTGRRKLDDYELATRLAYYLTASPPDAELAASANAGRVREDITEHATRLLNSEGARVATAAFLSEYMNLDLLESTEKSADLFPNYDQSLKAAMREQTVRTLTALTFDEGSDYRSLFTTPRTFLNADLARLYDVNEALFVQSDFRPYEFAAGDARVGLLGHASFLAMNSHVSSTSPTHRGKFVREVLLCQGVPAPPPDAVTELPELGDDIKTNRQRFEQHSVNPACGGCHSLMDPIGLGFENFDAIGAFRETQNGEIIDATGDLDGTAYDGPAQLGALIAEHPDLTRCFVRTLFRQASGSLATPLEEPLLDALYRDFESANFNLRELLVASATHPAFGYVRELDQAPTEEAP